MVWNVWQLELISLWGRLGSPLSCFNLLILFLPSFYLKFLLFNLMVLVEPIEHVCALVLLVLFHKEVIQLFSLESLWLESVIFPKLLHLLGFFSREVLASLRYLLIMEPIDWVCGQRFMILTRRISLGSKCAFNELIYMLNLLILLVT